MTYTTKYETKNGKTYRVEPSDTAKPAEDKRTNKKGTAPGSAETDAALDQKKE
jgi:hypothetical protein